MFEENDDLMKDAEESTEEFDENDEKNAGSSESKDEKFRRLATARVNKTLAAIEKIGNLSNKSTYAYSDEQIDKIFTALEAKLTSTHEKFKKEEKAEESFTL